MSLTEKHNRLKQFFEDNNLSDWGIKFHGVIYQIIDFEPVPSEDKEFKTYNILTKRSHSYPYSMHQLSFAAHTSIGDCNSAGKTVESAVASAKRKCVSQVVSILRWGLHGVQYHHTRFVDWTKSIDQYRIGDIPNPAHLDEKPVQEVNYVVPAYSGKTLYVSGVLCSHGKELNWNEQEVHKTGCYIGTSFKSIDAAIGDRLNKESRYVANMLTAA